MRFLVLFAVIACASAMVVFDAKLDSEWENFKALHQKTYETVSEESYRYEII